MGKIPSETQARRLRRKSPLISSSHLKPKGHHQSVKGVARVYLEDIERAYRVMEAYLPFSPSAQRSQEHYQSMKSHYDEMVRLYTERGDEKSIAELTSPEEPNPIVIETSDYEPAFTQRI